MIRKIVSCLLIACSFTLLQAQNELLQNKWSYNTAFLIPAGKWESGIFQPFRYGVSARMEAFTNVLALPIIPGAGIKYSYGTIQGFELATEHSLSTPTPFLRMMSRKGIGGLISPEYSFPFILSISNSIVGSREIASSLMLSAKAGFVFALRNEKPDPQSSIDLPLFYPRMAHYYQGSSVHAGVDLKGSLGSKWFYNEGVKMIVITRSENNFFFENAGSLMWATRKSFRIRGGYVLAYGKYPYITPKWQLWPTLDIVLGSK